MRKLLGKFCLLVLPVLAYIIIFLIFDPKDYSGLRQIFGLQGNSLIIINYNGDKASGNVYSKMKYIYQMDTEEKVNLILGDSRCMSMNPQKIYEDTGEEYLNLSFGGGSLKERVDQFWFADKYQKIGKVMFQIGYYEFNKGHSTDRMGTVLSTVEKNRFFAYLFNLDNNIEVMQEIIKKVSSPNEMADGVAAEGKPQEDRFSDYASIIYDICRLYSLGEEDIDAVIEIAKYCNMSGIEIKFFTAPLHRSIWNEIVEPLELEDEMADYKQRISEFAPIYDMEYKSALTDWDESWSDGHHFQGEVMGQVLDILFGSSSQYVKIWSDGTAEGDD